MKRGTVIGIAARGRFFAAAIAIFRDVSMHVQK
jgi:hypothetical protein